MQSRTALLLALAVLVVGAGIATAGSLASERFTITTTGAPGAPTRVLAEGLIRGAGTVSLKSSQNTRVDHMTLRLPKGNVLLVAVEKSYSVQPEPAKCIAIGVGRGSFTIRGGTGPFAGAHGAGTYLRHGVLYGARNKSGACLGRNAPIARTSVHLTMTGNVALP